MHELAIARSLGNLVIDAARRHDATRVVSALVEIGELAGVDPQSLEFAFEVVTKDTCAQGCRLLVRRAPLQVRCDRCGREGDAGPELSGCPACGAASVRVTSGRQLRLVSIDVEDEPGQPHA